MVDSSLPLIVQSDMPRSPFKFLIFISLLPAKKLILAGRVSYQKEKPDGYKRLISNQLRDTINLEIIETFEQMSTSKKILT